MKLSKRHMKWFSKSFLAGNYQKNAINCTLSVAVDKKSHFIFVVYLVAAQNTGNRISELPDFNFFCGRMPPDPPPPPPHTRRVLTAPCGQSRPLDLKQLPTSNFIDETPALVFTINFYHFSISQCTVYTLF